MQRIGADPNAMGIFGYSFLFENTDALKPVLIEGVEPDADTIADKSYPISRPLYFYVKNAHRGVIPGLNEFIEEYMSDDALAAGGYLSERGLVALSEDRLGELQNAVLDGTLDGGAGRLSGPADLTARPSSGPGPSSFGAPRIA